MLFYKFILLKNIDATIEPIMLKSISIPIHLYLIKMEYSVILKFLLTIFLSSIWLSLLHLIIEHEVKDFVFLHHYSV